MAEIKAGAHEALENLRELARGIYPPLLADLGLAAALEAQARRAPVAVTVVAYFDLRIRKEAFDLAVTTQRLQSAQAA